MARIGIKTLLDRLPSVLHYLDNPSARWQYIWYFDDGEASLTYRNKRDIVSWWFDLKDQVVRFRLNDLHVEVEYVVLYRFEPTFYNILWRELG